MKWRGKREERDGKRRTQEDFKDVGERGEERRERGIPVNEKNRTEKEEENEEEGAEEKVYALQDNDKRTKKLLLTSATNGGRGSITEEAGKVEGDGEVEEWEVKETVRIRCYQISWCGIRDWKELRLIPKSNINRFQTPQTPLQTDTQIIQTNGETNRHTDGEKEPMLLLVN